MSRTEDCRLKFPILWSLDTEISYVGLFPAFWSSGLVIATVVSLRSPESDENYSITPDHDFIGARSPGLASLLLFSRTLQFGRFHRASVHTRQSSIRFKNLCCSVRSYEVRSSRCSVPVLVAAASLYAGHGATRSANGQTNSFSPFQGADAHAHLCRAWEDVCANVLGPRGTPSHVRVIAFR